MLVYQRRRNRGGKRVLVDHPIYESRAEAEAAGVEGIVNWREAPDTRREDGGWDSLWVEDDFGFVSEARRAQRFVDKKGKEFRQVDFVFGSRYVSGVRWGFGKHKEVSGWDKECRRERMKRFVAAYSRMVATGQEITESDWALLGRLHRKNDQKPAIRARWLVSRQEVKAMVRDELARIMSDGGLEPSDVVQFYEDIRGKAMDEGSLGLAMQVVDRYREMLDMTPDKVVTTDQRLLMASGSGLDHLIGAGSGAGDDGDDGEVRDVSFLQEEEELGAGEVFEVSSDDVGLDSSG